MNMPADSGNTVKNSHPHVEVRPAWLAQHSEPVIEPLLPIIDAHHHLWEFPDKRYRSADFLEDIGTGHNVRATVFVECKTHYKSSGAEALRPVGEVEFALNEAKEVDALRLDAVQSTLPDVCAAIVAYADLQLGAEVRPVLQQLYSASGGRLRGIRNVAVWHADPTVRASAAAPPPHLLASQQFHNGFRELAPIGLTFDAWLIHTQIDELHRLANAFPDTQIALNHVGGPLALGPYRNKRDEVFKDWREAMGRLARCPNVCVKLGGFGMPLFGIDFHKEALPPNSVQLAEAIRPYVITCIELFGATRCMFESNFPVDKGNCSYDVLWNAFKRITAGASEQERAALFYGTAAEFYRIGHG